MLTEGVITGYPPTLRDGVRVISASMMDTSADVPPMSSVNALLHPESLATAAAPTTPAAGPDRRVRTGMAAVLAAEAVPPADSDYLIRVLIRSMT